MRALFLFYGLNDGTNCDLREAHESLLRSVFSPTHPVRFFPPANPPIALQSFTRNARFSQFATATQCSKVRSDVVRDGPSLRSQTTRGACGLSSAEAGDDHPHPGAIPVCALAEQRKLPSLPLPPFAEPSSSVAVRFHLSLKQWFRVQPLAFREHED